MGGTRLGTTEDSKVLGVDCEGVDRICTVELDTRSVHRHSKRKAHGTDRGRLPHQQALR
jgi:hypothetical protein